MTLGWTMAYQRAFRARVAQDGLLAVAPASLAFVLVTLAVSDLWRDPGGGHQVVRACCAWRATSLTHGAGALLPLFGSAFLVRRPVEAVRKIRSPQTTGELTPAPGTGTFQRTFSVRDQCTGRPVSALTPLPRGPRQPGQLSPRAEATPTTRQIAIPTHTRIRRCPLLSLLARQ